MLTLKLTPLTVDLIIDTVQAKIKTSQLFREKITDWLKDQVGDWNKGQEKVQQYIKEIQRTIDQEIHEEVPLEFQQFSDLIVHLREQKVSWPSHVEWGDFIEDLFSLDETKNWFKTQFKHLKPLQIQNYRNQLKQHFKIILNNEPTQIAKKTRIITNAIINNTPLSLKMFDENMHHQRKIAQIRKILPIQTDTLSRVLKRTASLEDVIKDYFDLVRREQFLEALKLDNIMNEGVSPEILEWLLVSHEILLPQEVAENNQ